MDVALAVRGSVRRVKDKHLVKLLGALRPILEHGAHRGIAINIGIFAFNVIFERGLEGQILVHLHQFCVHLTHTRALVAVQDVLLRSACVTAFDQHLLHCILYVLNRRYLVARSRFQHFFNLFSQTARHLVILTARCLRRAEDRRRNLVQFKGGLAPIPFDNLLNHTSAILSHIQTLYAHHKIS